MEMCIIKKPTSELGCDTRRKRTGPLKQVPSDCFICRKSLAQNNFKPLNTVKSKENKTSVSEVLGLAKDLYK